MGEEKATLVCREARILRSSCYGDHAGSLLDLGEWGKARDTERANGSDVSRRRPMANAPTARTTTSFVFLFFTSTHSADD